MSLKTKKQHPRFQSGLTLIEMMIAMVLGLFVSAITITIFSTTVRSNVENMKMIRLNQELRGTMTFIVDELKRAGYSADPDNNSFINAFDPSTASCILYSYDEDGDGSVNTASPKEEFGFRLNADDNEIKWARDTGADGCDFTGQSITDANIAKITKLEFDITGSVNTADELAIRTGILALPPGIGGVSIYEVTITLTGTTDLAFSSDANDPSRTIAETIRIRNEAPK